MSSNSKLSGDDLNARFKVIHEKTPKAGQLLAIDPLFNEKKDVIFIAQTGYRKSMVFDFVSALKGNTVRR